MSPSLISDLCILCGKAGPHEDWTCSQLLTVLFDLVYFLYRKHTHTHVNTHTLPADAGAHGREMSSKDQDKRLRRSVPPDWLLVSSKKRGPGAAQEPQPPTVDQRLICSCVLAAVVLICVTQWLAGPRRTHLTQVLSEMPVWNLPGVSELRSGADGVGPSQAGGYGRLKGEGVLTVTRLSAAEVLVER